MNLNAAPTPPECTKSDVKLIFFLTAEGPDTPYAECSSGICTLEGTLTAASICLVCETCSESKEKSGIEGRKSGYQKKEKQMMLRGKKCVKEGRKEGRGEI